MTAHAGYGAIQHVLPVRIFVLMLTDGGRSLEDLRMIHTDRGLRGLLHLDHLPSMNASWPISCSGPPILSPENLVGAWLFTPFSAAFKKTLPGVGNRHCRYTHLG